MSRTDVSLIPCSKISSKVTSIIFCFPFFTSLLLLFLLCPLYFNRFISYTAYTFLFLSKLFLKFISFTLYNNLICKDKVEFIRFSFHSYISCLFIDCSYNIFNLYIWVTTFSLYILSKDFFKVFSIL